MSTTSEPLSPRHTRPAAAAPRPYHFPRFERRRLSNDMQLVVAFTSTARIGGFATRTRNHLKLTGAELAAGIPAGHAIVLDPGHDDGRVFLPEVIAGDAAE